MAAKNEVAHEMRKDFIETKVSYYLSKGVFSSVNQIYLHIAENHLFCDVSTVKRALLPFKRRSVSILNKNQTNLF
jgi:hypothetical protein